MATSEEESDLFKDITEGCLTTEQLEELRNLQKLSSQWVINDEDICSDSDDDDSDDDGNVPVERISELEGSVEPSLQIISGYEHDYASNEQLCQEPAENGMDHNMKNWQTMLTKRFIKGELTFTEFTELAERTVASQNSEPIKGEGDQNETGVSANEDDEEIGSTLEYVDDLKDVDYQPSTSKVRERQPRRKSPRKRSVMYSSVKEKELENEIQKHRKERKARRYRKSVLPADLHGLVGEANMCFAREEYEDAIKMCMEVIRLEPMFPEPFQTLGLIYEELGDMDKSLQFALISAYLSGNDGEEWIRLAEMSLERGDVKQAITCYKKASRCEPNNLDLVWTQCKLYEQIGERKRAMEQMQQILKLLKAEDGELGLQIARDVTKAHFESRLVERAITTMRDAFQRFPDYITSEDVNLLLELQMKQKQYGKSVQVLCENCGVQFEPAFLKEDCSSDDAIMSRVQNARSCTTPKVLPIDLSVKLMVCLIHLKGNHLITEFLGRLLQENPEEMGDLYLDVAEAYMDVQMYSEARALLESLASSEKFNLAAVWLRYGECLTALGKLEESANAYVNVVRLAPSHSSARMILAGLLQQLGRSEEALDVLKAENEDASIDLDPELLVQRANLLFSREAWDDFLYVAKLIHSRHTLPWNEVSSSKILSLSSRKIREYLKEVEDKGQRVFSAKDFLNPDDVWDVFLKMCRLLFDLELFDELYRVTTTAATSVIFLQDDEKLKDCRFMRLLSSVFNNNYEDAYALAKIYVAKEYMNSYKAWGLLNYIIIKLQDLRHNKFCLRLLLKNPDHLILGLMNGNCALMAGSFKHALCEYMQIFKLRPSEPMVTMLIGLIFTHMVCQKFSGKKHSLIIQATAFLNRYLDLRGDGQETYYNLGRAMHQMSLAYVAMYYYKKALEFEPAIPSTDQCDIFDLRREIAFNLSLLYQASGNSQLAKLYLSKYCIV